MHAVFSFRRQIWLAALLSVAAVVALTLLLPGDLYLSESFWDMGEFAALRGFVADSILGGHFPLWNPYIYSGEPLLGDFQSAELYPPNVIFLILPLARAVNLSFLLHLLILGWGAGIWSSRRGHHPLAATLVGLTAALSGPVFLRLANGQLAYLIGAAWAPWILCGLEAAWRGPARKPLLLTMAAVALQILGGHPQYVFYVAVAAGLHAVMQTVLEPAVRRRALPLLAMAYGGGALLAMAQLLPGLAAMAESVRQGKLDYEFVRLSGFPPENLLTLIAPRFFGDFNAVEYWGRYYLWEMCVFIGVSGVALAVLAWDNAESKRAARADWCLLGILFVLALGDHTPLLRFLYDHVLFFDKFRSLSKFTYPAMLFGLMAMAAGADAVIRGRLGRISVAVGFVVAGLVVAAPGLGLLLHPESLAGILNLAQKTGESRLANERSMEPAYIHSAGVQAGESLLFGGIILIMIGAALLLARRHPGWRWTPLVLLPLELICFVHANFTTTRLDNLVPSNMKDFLTQTPGDYRVINPRELNEGYLQGAPDLWGDNPSVLKRYAEFLAFTQGDNPDHANQVIVQKKPSIILALLRLRFVFIIKDGRFQVLEYHNTLPHALLFDNYQIKSNRDAIFAEFAQPDYDPRATVFLESEPNIRPLPTTTPGTVKVTEVNSDLLTIEADTATPAILLITDPFSRDWQARPLEGSVQTHYDIQPGDYILRAIPLQAGHHLIAMEYNPPSFHRGLIISALAWLVWLGCWFWPHRKRAVAAAVTDPPAEIPAGYSPRSG